MVASAAILVSMLAGAGLKVALPSLAVVLLYPIALTLYGELPAQPIAWRVSIHRKTPRSLDRV